MGEHPFHKVDQEDLQADRSFTNEDTRSISSDRSWAAIEEPFESSAIDKVDDVQHAERNPNVDAESRETRGDWVIIPLKDFQGESSAGCDGNDEETGASGPPPVYDTNVESSEMKGSTKKNHWDALLDELNHRSSSDAPENKGREELHEGQSEVEGRREPTLPQELSLALDTFSDSVFIVDVLFPVLEAWDGLYPIEIARRLIEGSLSSEDLLAVSRPTLTENVLVRAQSLIEACLASEIARRKDVSWARLCDGKHLNPIDLSSLEPCRDCATFAYSLHLAGALARMETTYDHLYLLLSFFDLGSTDGPICINAVIGHHLLLMDQRDSGLENSEVVMPSVLEDLEIDSNILSFILEDADMIVKTQHPIKQTLNFLYLLLFVSKTCLSIDDEDTYTLEASIYERLIDLDNRILSGEDTHDLLDWVSTAIIPLQRLVQNKEMLWRRGLVRKLADAIHILDPQDAKHPDNWEEDKRHALGALGKIYGVELRSALLTPERRWIESADRG